MKLLLHACCAPCLTSCIEGLRDDNIKPGVFWYNPNIHPFTEYLSRKESLLAYAYEEKFELIINDKYGLRKFVRAVYEKEKNDDFARCVVCYRMRFAKAAKTASQNGYDAFSTTLLTSPYQNHDLIRQVGTECAEEAGVKFFYKDFRPWFREGQKKAKNSGRYMQKYCGCIFSEEERYL